MAIRSGGARTGAMAEINVTPMADVVIVLLIVFMLAVPLLREPGFALPPAQRAGEQRDGPPVLLLEADGSIQLEGVAVAGDEAVLAETVRRLDAAVGPRSVQVKAPQDLPFARLDALLSRLRAHGIRELTLVTRPLAAS